MHRRFVTNITWICIAAKHLSLSTQNLGPRHLKPFIQSKQNVAQYVHVDVGWIKWSQVKSNKM